MTTDQELIELTMDEARAYLATIANAERYDAAPSDALIVNGHHLLREWNAARSKLRAAVLERLEAEQPA